MAYCIKCGRQLEPDSRFCRICGAAVVSTTYKSSSQSNEVREGKVHVCPSCNATINAFVTKCPYCYHEFRDSKPTDAISNLSSIIQGINASTTPISDTFEFMGLGMGADHKKIDAVRSCPIPNTREDIIEFAMMANANIDVDLYAHQVSTRTQISDAWLDKLNQAYQKAKLTLGNDPAVEMIGEMYKHKSDAATENKRKRNNSLVLAIIFLISLPFLVYIAFRLI